MLEDSSLSSSQAAADATCSHANPTAPAAAAAAAVVAPTSTAVTNTNTNTDSIQNGSHFPGLTSARKFIARPLNSKPGDRPPPFNFYPRPLTHYRRQMDQLSRDLSRQSLSIESSPRPGAPSEPIPTESAQQPQPLSSSTEQRVDIYPPSPALEPRTTSCKKARRPTETRLGKNPSLQNLVTHMIDQGVQCNVQASTPTATSIPPLPEPPASLPSLPPVPAHHRPDRMVIDDDDEGYQDYLDKPISAIQFRRADGSRNCRKFDLPYKTAGEAALQCKGVKRNIPRRRKRPKASLPPPPASTPITPPCPCPPVSV